MGDAALFARYATTPLYNIKAVVQQTGLQRPTLRAWERRYGICTPERTGSNYRLYSERDIAMLSWLKARVDAGMSISQAVALLNSLPKHHDATSAGAGSWPGLANGTETPLRTFLALRGQLVEALLRFDESVAETVIGEAFALHDISDVCLRIVAPALVEIGERWHRGEASAIAEHFATSFLRRKLFTVLNAYPHNGAGPLIVCGCAPGDWHEMGIMMIALLLRRAGKDVMFLGQNVPLTQFTDELSKLRPVLVCISSSTEESAQSLIEMAQAVQQMTPPAPLFGYGGRIFNERPQIKQQVMGIFLGENASQAVINISALLSHRQPGPPVGG